MTEQLKADKIIDLKGLLCPMPVVEISKAIKELPVGSVIEATATDPGVLADIPAWTRTTGNELVKIEREGSLIKFLVRKTK